MGSMAVSDDELQALRAGAVLSPPLATEARWAGDRWEVSVLLPVEGRTSWGPVHRPVLDLREPST